MTEALPRIESYIAHRRKREQQVMAALEQGLTNVEQIVRYVYPPNLRRGLKEAAARNVLTHLAKLQKEGGRRRRRLATFYAKQGNPSFDYSSTLSLAGPKS